MMAGLLNKFHGVIKTDPTAAIMPPARQLILLGAILEKSKAGETKLATILIPTVAMQKVIAPIKTAVTESILLTVSTGSVISLPKTGSVAEVVTTVTSEKAKKFTGKPQKLPLFTALKSLQYLEKSPKFRTGPEK